MQLSLIVSHVIQLNLIVCDDNIAQFNIGF